LPNQTAGGYKFSMFNNLGGILMVRITLSMKKSFDWLIMVCPLKCASVVPMAHRCDTARRPAELGGFRPTSTRRPRSGAAWRKMGPSLGAALLMVCAAASVGFGLPSRPPTTLAPGANRRQAGGPETPARSGASQMRGQLKPSGRWLAYPDGGRFRWRGVSGFMLNQLVSDGRESEAKAYLDWARKTGFNVVRIFAMLPGGWFEDKDFTPEEGLAALPRTLELARAADLYAEVTVLANTASLPARADVGAFVERAGRICSAAGNCALVEVAREIAERAQRPDVRDPGTLARWAARVPASVPVALGAPPDESGGIVDAAPVITIHLDRTPPRWERISRIRTLAQTSARTRRFVIDNEPLAAGERSVPQERDSEPAVFFAQGALSRVFEVGSNFHFEGGLRARVPGPIEQQCAEAFIAGTRIVDDAYMLTFQDAGAPYSPVLKTDAVAAFAGLTGVLPRSSSPGNVLVLVGVQEEPVVEWRPPWRRIGVVASFPRVQVWSIGRTP